jgi:hypothetical protein
MLVCFIALALSKQIEISAAISIRVFINHGKKITDAWLSNKITKQEMTLRVGIP